MVRAQQLVGELFVYARFLRSSGNFGRGRGLGETHLDGETDLDTTPVTLATPVNKPLEAQSRRATAVRRLTQLLAVILYVTFISYYKLL